MDIPENYILRFAALLHDIGKFWQGAGGKGKHEELSVRFIREYLPKEIEEGITFIRGHHDAGQYLAEGYYRLKILVLADWLASSERKDLEEGEEKGKREQTPMQSIFSNISINNGNYITPRFYEINSLFNEEFPKEGTAVNLKKNYENLWKEFVKEIKELEYKDKKSYFISLYYLLKKYTSFIPSAVWQSKPDISLFDHSRITCALAECIYKNGMDEDEIGKILDALNKRNKKVELNEKEKEMLSQYRFLLVGGDISGIQKFIYSITSKGAAKGLKGRSFYLQLLSEAIAKYILKKMDLSIANLLYSAGGHFYIIAPFNVDVDNVCKELEEILMEIHQGELFVAIDKVELSIEDLIEKRVGEKWKKLGEKLGEKKKKKFSKIIDKNFFDPYGDFNDVCHVCGLPSKYIVEEEGIKKCKLCKSFEGLSEKLAGKDKIKARYIIECQPDGSEKEGTYEWNIAKFGIKYEILENINEIRCKEGIIYKINDDNFIEKVDDNFSYGIRFMFQTSLKELKDLAENAEGLKRWGVLRGDVDNLGQIFIRGLKREDRSISRISTLSSLMSLFFEYHINKICEKEKFKDKIYGVYAGGDDFFIIGSWDILPELAHEIYENFREYTAYNPDITLSIGISIAPSEKYPIHKIAELSGNELEKAKRIKSYYEETNIGIKIEKEKDAITFLGMPIKWQEYPKLVKFKEELLKFLEKTSRGSLQKFYSVYELYRIAKKKVKNPVLAKYDNRYGKWRWRLAYIIARMKANGDKERIKQLIIDNIDYSPIVIKWVEYLTR